MSGATERGASARSKSIELRTAGEPVLAIVSLQKQRITVYDANGWILRAPVSSGQKGRETPAGIFSVIQKEADHYSNIYDDAFMPHMQRITWSGIALHGGQLPGYPASHGCVARDRRDEISYRTGRQTRAGQSAGQPGLAFNPAASMPAIAQISSLSEVSPLTPTAPSRTPPLWISTPPGTGTRRPCASVFTAPTK